MITPESVVSRQCLRELEIAAAQRKLIIPVVLRDVGRDQTLPDDLAKPNWIFFPAGYDTGSVLGHDAERALDEVIQALEEDLPWRDAHTRLAVRTQEWASAQRDRSFLLRGSDSGAAEEWLDGPLSTRRRRPPPCRPNTSWPAARPRCGPSAPGAWR